MKLLHTFFLPLLLIALSATAQDDYHQESYELEAADHGGFFSLGGSLLGWGIAGLELNTHPAKWLAIEGGVKYRPGLIVTENGRPGGQSSTTVTWTHGAALHLGSTFYFSKKFNRKDTKVLAHGLFVKGGYSTGTFKEALFALGWSRERFIKNRPGNSYTFQLGAGFTRLISSSIPLQSYGNIAGSLFSPTLFIKFKWDFYLVEYQR